jgi:hypothetical protein
VRLERALPPALPTLARVRLQTYRQAGTAEIGRTRANFSPSSVNRIAELLPWNIVMGGSLRVAA